MEGVGPVRDMKTVHQDLQITNAMFNALAEDLQIAMEQHNVPSSISNKLVAKLAPMQRDIVTK
jgi:hemoglobin